MEVQRDEGDEDQDFNEVQEANQLKDQNVKIYNFQWIRHEGQQDKEEQTKITNFQWIRHRIEFPEPS